MDPSDQLESSDFGPLMTQLCSKFKPPKISGQPSTYSILNSYQNYILTSFSSPSRRLLHPLNALFTSLGSLHLQHISPSTYSTPLNPPQRNHPHRSILSLPLWIPSNPNTMRCIQFTWLHLRYPSPNSRTNPITTKSTTKE